MKDKRPNILFITTDQQRRDTMPCYGNDLIRTPAFDRLAREGIVFDRAYCQSPICLPSRVTMITGKTCAHHGVTLHNASMRDDEPTLGDTLASQGYTTHFIGKPHFKSQQHRGTEESIADWRDGLRDGWTDPYAGFQTAEIALGHTNPLVGHYGQWLRENHPDAIEAFRVANLERLPGADRLPAFRNRIPEEAHSTAFVGERTRAFLERAAAKDEPFYCFASFPDPHWPLTAPEPWFSMYDNVEIPPQTPYLDEAKKPAFPPLFREVRDGKTGRYNGGSRYMTNPARDIPTVMRPYWGAVSFIDHHVGKILDDLDRLGLAENTLVVFTTDHGEMIGAHGLINKGTFLYEELIQVPLLVRFPGRIPAGSRTPSFFSFTDFVPTLLEMTVCDAGELAFDGVSQVAALESPGTTVRDHVTVHHATLAEGDASAPDQFAIIEGDWKLVHFAGCEGAMLFNLAKDPRETANLFSDPANRGVRDHLTHRLLDSIILAPDRRALREELTADPTLSAHILPEESWGPYFEEALGRTNS